MKNFITLSLLALFTSASVAQWSEQTSGVTTALYSVSAIDNETAWICGAGGQVLRTTNGGYNWLITTSPNSALPLYNIWGIDSNRALVTGSSSTATYVYKTTDAGVSWTQVFSQNSGFINVIVKVSGTSNQFAMIGDPVGGRWSLWHSNNNGSTWDSAGLYIPQAGNETGYNNSAFDIGPNGSDYFWFGTNNTRIYRGIFGQNWSSQPTTGQPDILAILFLDTNYGIAGGSSGVLYTSNAGNNWITSASVPGTGSINGFASIVVDNYYCIRGNSIYRTSNGGLNWFSEYSQTGTYTHMQGTRDRQHYTIWAIRNNGGISALPYPIGIKPISHEVPQSFVLYQNFPNPFNPMSKIKYDIAKQGKVKLVIFDALGREVEILVNENLKPGSYEIKWEASNFPSGVYFYKLTAGDYSETRKMILLK
jgi:photosystem II stability/assembly factor-like uncharacterized protein